MCPGMISTMPQTELAGMQAVGTGWGHQLRAFVYGQVALIFQRRTESALFLTWAGSPHFRQSGISLPLGSGMGYTHVQRRHQAHACWGILKSKEPQQETIFVISPPPLQPHCSKDSQRRCHGDNGVLYRHPACCRSWAELGPWCTSAGRVEGGEHMQQARWAR